MSAWSDLPNAKHIDRVIASLKEHPEIWAEAGGTDRSAAWDATLAAARNAARSAAWDAARSAAWGAARLATRDAAWFALYRAARDAAWAAILALIAYDDCDQYLDMPSEQLHAWSLLTEQSAAMLLLPAVVAFERIKKMETV